MEKEKFSAELLEKAKTAQNPEELRGLAREAGLELTDQQAAACFERLQPPVGEISDEELDNVAGGGCGKQENERASCPHCGSEKIQFQPEGGQGYDFRCKTCGHMFNISDCVHLQ